MRHTIAIDAGIEQEPLVESGVRFAATLLRFSDSFYPFGLLSTSGEVKSIFTQHSANSDMQGGMIEEIEWLLLELSFQAKHTSSVLVYNAQVECADNGVIDVIATKIIEASGAETTRLYPYEFSAHQVCISKPITY